MLLRYPTFAVAEENVASAQDDKEWTAWAKYLIATFVITIFSMESKIDEWNAALTSRQERKN